jgi:ubiquinone/menaquinone biosynthesis C-methylase UbiE
MSWFVAAVYDHWMRAVETACLFQWRAELLRDLEGEVLEVGVGTGANLPHYPKTVKRLVLAEPDRHMRRRLQVRCGSSGFPQAEVSDASLHGLPMSDASFDAVVSTLVLCSVPDLHAALAEVFRVLRPGGRFVFLEHVAADRNPTRLKWQRRVEPVWKRVAGNCHLTRRTEQAILAAGFQIEWIERESMRKAMPLARPSIRGAARKPALRTT